MRVNKLFLGWAALAALGVIAGEPVKFTVFGDCQHSHTSAASGVKERLAMPRVIAAMKPDFVLATGDLMDRAEKPGAYRKFAEFQAPFLTVLPFFPTLGNHDALGVAQYRDFVAERLTKINPTLYNGRKFDVHFDEDDTPAARSFRDPELKKYQPAIPSGVNFRTNYAFKHRNCYFISMEVGTRWWSNTPLPWLEKELKRASSDPEVEHIFVYLHHPIYSSQMADAPPNPAKPGAGECMKPVRDQYNALFRRYGVRMVFSGHVHNYEHLWVPADERPSRPADGAERPKRYPLGDGIHYIVTGGGGGPLGSITPRRELPSFGFRQAAERGYHVVTLEVDGKKITVRRVAISGGEKDFAGKVTDEFVIEPSK